MGDKQKFNSWSFSHPVVIYVGKSCILTGKVWTGKEKIASISGTVSFPPLHFRLITLYFMVKKKYHSGLYHTRYLRATNLVRWETKRYVTIFLSLVTYKVEQCVTRAIMQYILRIAHFRSVSCGQMAVYSSHSFFSEWIREGPLLSHFFQIFL